MNSMISASVGFFKSLNMENSSVTATVVVDETDSFIKFIDEISSFESIQGVSELWINTTGRYKKIYKQKHIYSKSPSIIRKKGTYMITGGSGKIAQILAEYLVKKYQAHVFLIGRKTIEIDNSKFGNSVEYIKCDLTSQKDTQNMFEHNQDRFSSLNGIIHCIGTTRDKLFKQKGYFSFLSVLDAKIKSTFLLDEISQSYNLDFFAYFSSIASVLGNLGQTDYAYANSFLDQFAIFRNDLSSKGLRYGKTISINWPLWEEGGLQISEEQQKFIFQEEGFRPISAEEGMQAFEVALCSPGTQIIPVAGDLAKINRSLKISKSKTVDKESANLKSSSIIFEKDQFSTGVSLKS